MARRYPLLKRTSWRLEYLGYRLMEGGFSLLPLPLIDRLGSGIGFLFYYLSASYRRLAIRNLRIAYGQEKDLPEIQRLARATCQRTIANFLSTLKTTTLPSSQMNNYVSVEGKEELHTALAQGKGVILVLGHMGNWEVLNRLHDHLPPGIQAGGIYQRLKNPLVNAHLLTQREQDGSCMFDKKKGFHAPASFVKNGGLLIVVADQKTGRAGIPIPFFGRLSALSPLPSLLAKKAGSPVFAAGIETTAPGHWTVILKPLSNKPQTNEIISTLETLIRRSPADYLWLHNRWRVSNRYPLSLATQKFKDQYETTRPLRVLILSDAPPCEQALASHLSQRHPQDIPLIFGHLIVSEEAPNPLPKHPFLEAPTTEQLAAKVRALNASTSLPIQLALVLSPSPQWLKALSSAKIPQIEAKTADLSLPQFLEQLTAPPSTK